MMNSKSVWLFGAVRQVPAWARWASVSCAGIITVYETRPVPGGQQGFGNDFSPQVAILGGEMAMNITGNTTVEVA